MRLFEVITSIVCGTGAGLLYGLSFLLQGKRALYTTSSHPKKDYLALLFYPLVRLGTFGLGVYYLLLTDAIHFILFLIFFLISFWLIILKQKV